MIRSVAITARVDEVTAVKLDQLADRYERSRSWLIAKAVQEYVERETELFEMIRAAEEDLASGRVYSQEEMGTWLDEKLKMLAIKKKAAA